MNRAPKAQGRDGSRPRQSYRARDPPDKGTMVRGGRISAHLKHQTDMRVGGGSARKRKSKRQKAAARQRGAAGRLIIARRAADSSTREPESAFVTRLGDMNALAGPEIVARGGSGHRVGARSEPVSAKSSARRGPAA